MNMLEAQNTLVSILNPTVLTCTFAHICLLDLCRRSSTSTKLLEVKNIKTSTSVRHVR